MAPSSAALALKVAALFFLLALLVVPSLGRCGHSPPPPSRPPPPPPEASTISCNDCYSQCSAPCDSFAREQCDEYCDVEVACNSCMTKVMQDCKAKGTCTGSCDCNRSANRTCTNDCSTPYCDVCNSGYGKQCRDNCSKQCSAPNCVPPPPAPLPPAPAPAPGPMIPCDDCRSQCQSTCGAFVRENCGEECDRVGANCYKDCKVEECKRYQECYNADTCDCLDAGDTMETGSPCTSQCSSRYCNSCENGQGQQCSADCSKKCSAPNCIPSSPPQN